MKVKITENQYKTLLKVISEQEVPVLNPRVGEYFNALDMITGGALSRTGEQSDQSYEGNYQGNIVPPKNWLYPLGIRGRISSFFGKRNVSGGSSNHKGIDIATPSGSRVIAPTDGIVIDARDTTPNGCGGLILIDHGELRTKYCHLRQWLVRPGQQVKRGQIIGYSGGGRNDPYKGNATGACLHYEIIRSADNIALNPLQVQDNLA